jgi:soluble lytic murein transglycosylase
MKSRRKLTAAAALTCLTVFVVWLFTDVDGIARFLYPVSYEKDILLSSREHDVDPLLVAAIIRVESNFSPERVSAKKAAGLMQIMPQTAEWIVERGGYAPEAVEQLHQPDVAIELGVWYLRELKRQFAPVLKEMETKDAVSLLAAAYNAGPGTVAKWLNDRVWDGHYETREHIPYGETRHYVRRVWYYYEKYNDIYGEEWKEALN